MTSETHSNFQPWTSAAARKFLESCGEWSRIDDHTVTLRVGSREFFDLIGATGVMPPRSNP